MNEEFPEPERYELREGPAYQFELSRREFVQTLGAGLLISLVGPVVFAQRAPGSRERSGGDRLHIDTQGIVTVLTGKVEVGQGSRTEITQAAAEELHVSVDRVRLIMADYPSVPDDGGTSGSRTTPSTVPAIRRACAAARALLLAAAAENFGRAADGLRVEDGAVIHPGKDARFSYADLARMENLQSALKSADARGAEVMPVSEWKILGTPVPRVGGREIVTGEHRYPSDIRRPEMLYGKVLRPPALGATLSSIDLEPAQAMDGVTVVRDGNFVGCAAATSSSAHAAVQSLADSAKWELESGQPDSEELYDYLRQNASGRSRGGRGSSGNEGKVEEALGKAHKALRESYHIAYIQHVPMEPRAAVAEWTDGNLTVWTGTQQPARVRRELAQAFHVSESKVRVVVPDTGGAYGGKHTGEAALEAARLALAARKPVSLRWTREEEFSWAYFRPAGVIEMAGGLTTDGSIVGWQQVNIHSGGSALNTPYDIPAVHTEYKASRSPLRGGSYRGLAATANVFARESFMDELARAAGAESLAFRLKHLREPRLRAILEAATDRFDWARRRQSSPEKSMGLACGTEKGSFVAACVELELDRSAGTYKVLEVCEAFECGAVLNPDNLRAQIEGCIMQGLGGALREEMRFKDGRMLNPTFGAYRVPRFRDLPKIETVLVNRPDLPSAGAGETPIVAVAPAIANALAAATGARIRSLPIRNEQWKAA